MNQKKIINEKYVKKFVEKKSITLLDSSEEKFPHHIQESDDDISPYMMNIRWNPSDQSDDDISPYMMNIRWNPSDQSDDSTFVSIGYVLTFLTIFNID